MSDLSSIAAGLARKGGGIHLRQAVVTAVAEPLLTVTIGGSTTQVTGVRHLRSYNPHVSDTVWLVTDGRDLFVLGQLGSYP